MAKPKPAHPDQRASVGVALIAKDAEKTLPVCLASVRPFVQQVVVCVDDRTADRTAKVAKKAGADKVVPFTMCEEHRCPAHGTVQAQHFGRARGFSFTHLDPALDFWFWIDADDVLEGADLLPKVCAAIARTDALGLWLPYEYSYSVENGQRRVNTLFHRERLLRTHLHGERITWEWGGRVHETVKPLGVEARWVFPEVAMPWARPLRVVHQAGTHKSEHSAVRNNLLLEIDLEENPDDARTLFYLANGWFAMGPDRFPEAAYWYRRHLAVDANHHQRWQSAVYLHKALLRLGDLDGAEDAAWEAIRATDEHAEPYFALAECALARGKDEDVVKWTEVGRAKADPPPWVFVNPMDRAFNSRLPLAEALDRLGRIAEARREYEEAYRVVRAEPVKDAIVRLARTEMAMRRAQGAADLLAGKPDDEAIRLWEALDLPAGVRRFGRCRDAVMPAYLRRRDREAA